MPRIAARILIASASIPFASLLYLIICSAIWEYGSDESRVTLAHFAAGAAEWLFLVIVWGALWGGHVAWNRDRVFRLLSASIILGILMVAGYAVTGIVYATSSFYSPLSPFVSLAFSGLIPLIWLCITILVLRDTPAEQAARTGGCRP